MADAAATLEPAAAQPQAGADESDGAPPVGGAPAGGRMAAGHAADPQRRPLRTAGLVAVIVGLTGGVLGLAGLGFVTLRDDIRAIDARIDARFESFDARIDARFESFDAKIDAQVGLLRAEIAEVRADMNEGFARVDDRFAEVNAVLLDHTDRLARIEAVHGLSTHQ